MTRSQIIAAVKAKMDELHPKDQGVTIVDPQIDAQLDSAAVSLVEMLPSVLANPVTPATLPSLANYKEDLSVDVECPTDFVRLHRLRLSHWIRSVMQLYPDGDKLLYMQDYKHIKSTVRRPMAALYTKDGKDYITCYPPKLEDSTATPAVVNEIVEFVYVKKPTAAEVLGDNLIDLLAWNAASMIYSIAKKPDLAEVCQNRLAALIELRLKYRG